MDYSMAHTLYMHWMLHNHLQSSGLLTHKKTYTINVVVVVVEFCEYLHSTRLITHVLLSLPYMYVYVIAIHTNLWGESISQMRESNVVKFRNCSAWLWYYYTITTWLKYLWNKLCENRIVKTLLIKFTFLQNWTTGSNTEWTRAF